MDFVEGLPLDRRSKQKCTDQAQKCGQDTNSGGMSENSQSVPPRGFGSCYDKACTAANEGFAS